MIIRNSFIYYLLQAQALPPLTLYLFFSMCVTACIINNNNLIFLSFNLCYSCLSALPGHPGNLHHYHFSPALYLPLFTLFLA